MLRLRNIKIENGIAEADYFPEDGKKSAHIVVNLGSGEIVSFGRVDGYTWDAYPAHACQKLLSLAEEGSTDTECLVMWY